MQFDVVSLFPEMFTALTQSGVTRRAFEQQAAPHSLRRLTARGRHHAIEVEPREVEPLRSLLVREMPALIVACGMAFVIIAREISRDPATVIHE